MADLSTIGEEAELAILGGAVAGAAAIAIAVAVAVGCDAGAGGSFNACFERLLCLENKGIVWT